MLEGRKAAAIKIVYGALEMAEKKVGKPALEVLEQAAANAGPDLELKSRRIGGANYQVPIEVRPERKTGSKSHDTAAGGSRCAHDGCGGPIWEIPKQKYGEPHRDDYP